MNIKIFLLVSFLSIVSNHLFAQNRNLNNGVAIHGYDAVAYFLGNPKKGDINLTLNYKGANYQFSNKDNYEKFKANPSAFCPQYGGWCAYAMGNSGDLVDVNPETYKIVNGKLYLFYNKLFTNTLNSWNKNEQKLKTKADLNYSKISK